jgi:hypothetical protein
MRKFPPSVFIVLVLVWTTLFAPAADAAVPLPWSTTYNCPDWKQSDGLYPPAINCDGLTGYGDWTTSDGKEEQITAAANYPGGGGKGQRHWLGDPLANNSGGTKIEWTSPQPEIWIRWLVSEWVWVESPDRRIPIYVDVFLPPIIISDRTTGWA